MAYALLKIDKPAPHVCRILINRPDKLNALNYEIRDQMFGAVTDILRDTHCRALVFGGAGGNLSAGGDIPSMKGLTETQARDRMQHIHKLCRLIERAEIPVITAAEGICAGGAVGMALLGDIIISDPETRIMVPFMKLGLAPDWGMMRTLPRRVGIGRARRLIFEAKTVSGKEAFDMGLTDCLANKGEVMTDAIDMARKLTALPRSAVGIVKSRLRLDLSFEDDLKAEENNQARSLTGAEFEEGYQAFIEKRSADFTKI